VLNSYGDALGEDRQLLPFLERFMLLQSLHERAASSHERYEVLSRNTDNLQVLEGFGEMLHQLSHACRLVADNSLQELCTDILCIGLDGFVWNRAGYNCTVMKRKPCNVTA
jgi:uncharacterized membrane protein YccC